MNFAISISFLACADPGWGDASEQAVYQYCHRPDEMRQELAKKHAFRIFVILDIAHNTYHMVEPGGDEVYQGC